MASKNLNLTIIFLLAITNKCFFYRHNYYANLRAIALTSAKNNYKENRKFQFFSADSGVNSLLISRLG